MRLTVVRDLHLPGRIGPVLPLKLRRDSGERRGSAPMCTLLKRGKALSDVPDERVSTGRSCMLQNSLESLKRRRHAGDSLLERNDARGENDFWKHIAPARGRCRRSVLRDRLDERLLGGENLRAIRQRRVLVVALRLVGVGRPAVLLRDRAGSESIAGGGRRCRDGALEKRVVERVRVERHKRDDLLLVGDVRIGDELALLLLRIGVTLEDRVDVDGRHEEAESVVSSDVVERLLVDVAPEPVESNCALELLVKVVACLVVVLLDILVGRTREECCMHIPLGDVRVAALLTVLADALLKEGAGERRFERAGVLAELGRVDIVGDVGVENLRIHAVQSETLCDEGVLRDGLTADTDKARHFVMRACV